jgi:hypothetical protein
MDPITLTLAFMGAAAGAGLGLGSYILDSFSGGIFSRHEPKPLKLHMSAGIAIGALAFGSVPNVMDHFKHRSDPHPVTLKDCAKTAPAGTKSIELLPQPNGFPVCRYQP